MRLNATFATAFAIALSASARSAAVEPDDREGTHPWTLTAFPGLVDRIEASDAAKAKTEAERQLVESGRTAYDGEILGELADEQRKVRVHFIGHSYDHELGRVLRFSGSAPVVAGKFHIRSLPKGRYSLTLPSAIGKTEEATVAVDGKTRFRQVSWEWKEVTGVVRTEMATEGLFVSVDGFRRLPVEHDGSFKLAMPTRPDATVHMHRVIESEGPDVTLTRRLLEVPAQGLLEIEEKRGEVFRLSGKVVPGPAIVNLGLKEGFLRVRVFARKGDGALSAVTTAKSDGRFEFQGLPAGLYSVGLCSDPAALSLSAMTLQCNVGTQAGDALITVHSFLKSE